jgi:hypothetical protein
VAPAPRRPVSFVTVWFSDEIHHNVEKSPCVHDPMNEFIVVDNRGNAFHDNLGRAMVEGLARARHDLVAFVHEDVLLTEDWQGAFETSLAQLERIDPQWGVVGTIGWTAGRRGRREWHGHCSDPHDYFRNLTADDPFRRVDALDEQVVVLRRSAPVPLDPDLPSIHNIGWDLGLQAGRQGRRVYVVDAPTIHKFADDQGRPILRAEDSPKIRNRSTLAYLSDKEFSDRYFRVKWGLPAPGPALARRRRRRVPPPVVLVGRGGGGSRLLSVLARDLGIFIGSDVNRTGDSLEMVSSVYQGVLARLRGHASWQWAAVPGDILAAAQGLLQRARYPHPWGFKVPESILILDAIGQAFPDARYLHLIRDPLGTCLRRTHMTARLDNPIGQATLPAAYQHFGRSPAEILVDSPALHMAWTTWHQIDAARTFSTGLPADRYLEVRFERLVAAPEEESRRVGSWLGEFQASTDPSRAGWQALLDRVLRFLERARRTDDPAHVRLAAAVDPGRAATEDAAYPPEVRSRVSEILAPLRHELGYLPVTAQVPAP